MPVGQPGTFATMDGQAHIRIPMPTVNSNAALAKAYEKAAEKIGRREIPTTFIDSGQVLYRSINPLSPYTYLPKPAAGGHVSKGLANKLLIPGDGAADLKNRFSGPSLNGSIPPASGLYCVLQQQALVNESTHYSGKAPVWALAGRCVLRIRVMGRLLVADLSPHNPRALRFFRELGKDIWERVNDPKDCSVARGIGLAVAHSGLQGLCVQTVRESDRSDEERGDNLVLFAPSGRPVPALYIEGAYYYGKTADPEIFPVDFP
jgi:hypothetical protein